MNAPTTPAAAGTPTTSPPAVLDAEIAAFDALASTFILLTLAAASLVIAGAELVMPAIWLERLSMTVEIELAMALSVSNAMLDERSVIALERPSTCVERSEAMMATVEETSMIWLVDGSSVWRVASCVAAEATSAAMAAIEKRMMMVRALIELAIRSTVPIRCVVRAWGSSRLL